MRLLVFQHIDCEHPGSLRACLAEDGVTWDAINLHRKDEIPDMEAYDALWVMGGPMDVWDVDDHPWLMEEKRAIRHWVRELEKPFLGICLGHQLLADALGGTCGPQRPPEVGIMEIQLTESGLNDPLFAGMPERQTCLQWHSVRVAQPPEGAVVLARSGICPVQAMRIGPRAWSMQYHVEVEPDTVGNWAEIPAYRDALLSTLGEPGLDRMTSEANRHMPGFLGDAKTLYRNFMAAMHQG